MPSSGLTVRRRADLDGEAPPDRRRPASGAPPGLRRRPRASSSAQPRSCRRPSSTSPSRPSSSTSCSGQARSTRRSGAPSLSRTAPRPQATRSGELCGRIKATVIRTSPRAGGRDREAGGPRRGGVAYLRGRPRRPGSVHRVLRARTGGGRSRSDRTRRWRHTNGPPPTLGGRACRHEHEFMWRAVLPASVARHPCRACSSWLDENEPGRRAGPTDPCTPCRGAGDARPLRRGARDPHRSTCDAGRPRRGTHARGV